jgi:hypothetical protein
VPKRKEEKKRRKRKEEKTKKSKLHTGPERMSSAHIKASWEGMNTSRSCKRGFASEGLMNTTWMGLSRWPIFKANGSISTGYGHACWHPDPFILRYFKSFSI